MSRLGACVGAFAVVAILVATGSASAAETHPFLSSFNGSGEAPAPLGGPIGLAVDNSGAASDGTVYAADSANNVIDAFDSSGKYLYQLTGAKTVQGSFSIPWGLAVDQSNGDLYLSDALHGVIDKFKPGATEELEAAFGEGGQISAAQIKAGELGSPGTGGEFSPRGVAVDPANGNLYIGDEANAVIDIFNSSGEYLTQFSTAGGDLGIAAFAGNVIFTNGSQAIVYEAASGTPNPAFGEGNGVLDSGGATSAAVDPSNGDLYVADSGVVAQYDKSGALVHTFASGHFAAAYGLGIGKVNGRIYVPDNPDSDIAVFGPLAPEQTLRVSRTGSGSGSLTSSFPGIDCGATCEAEFEPGATITLFATPNESSTFSKWTGCESESGSECLVTLTATTEVQAEFTAIPQQRLTVADPGAGLGGGLVTGNSPGSEFIAIDCGNGATTCEAEYNQGATITLFAATTERSTFAGWGAGACKAEPTQTECEVEMSSAKLVNPEFTAIPQRKLTVVTEGIASATVTGTSPGFEFNPIDCGNGATVCEAEYNDGATITLTAQPPPHSRFVAWGAGECISEAGPGHDECTLEMSSAQRATAKFVNTHTLTVTRTGLGSVSANLGPISACTSNAGICAGAYDEASTVTLTASPAAHRSVTWKSGCTGQPSADVCEVAIGPSDVRIEVAFTPNTHSLTLIPSGLGSVTANSGAISQCSAAGGSCAGTYIEAATVTLKASPAAHQAVAWDGCTRSSADSCEIEIGPSDTTVRAAFVSNNHTLMITKSGSGAGSVTCNGGACAAAYPDGTALTLIAAPNPGSTFAGWSGGGCSGTAPCELTLESDTTLSATFSADPAPTLLEETCIVPKLSGATLGRARLALTAARCSLGKVTRVKKQDAQAGALVVKSSSPGVGATLPAGSAVNLELGLKAKKKGRR